MGPCARNGGVSTALVGFLIPFSRCSASDTAWNIACWACVQRIVWGTLRQVGEKLCKLCWKPVEGLGHVIEVWWQGIFHVFG